MAKKIHRQDYFEAQACKGQGDTRSEKGSQETGKAKSQDEGSKEDPRSQPPSAHPRRKSPLPGPRRRPRSGCLNLPSTRPEVTSKKAAPSKRTIVAKPRTKAVRPNADMTPASAVERVGGAMPPKNPHPGMMGDGTEEQNLNQPGMPEARITQEDVEIALKRTEPDRR